MKSNFLRNIFNRNHGRSILSTLTTAFVATFAVVLFWQSSWATPASEPVALFALNQNAFRAYAGGKIERVFSAEESHSDLHVSPDQRYVIFEQNEDLWLFDVSTFDTKQLTHAGKPSTEKYASVTTKFVLWSPDSTQFLYMLEPGETEDPEGEDPTLEVRNEKYGMYVFDLQKNASLLSELPNGKIHLWLKGGKFLIGANKAIAVYDVASKSTKPLPLDWDAGQFVLSPDGTFALAGVHTGMKMSQLVRVNIASGQITPITPAGAFTEYQWPVASPSGKRVAYQRRIGTENRKPVVTIVVGEEVVYKDAGHLTHLWIDDATMVIIERISKEAVVLDVDTKQVKGRYNLDV